MTGLSLLAFGLALLHIRAEYLGPRHHVYVLKPLTMLAIIAIAAGGALESGSFHDRAIVLGLTASLAGDAFLMLPRDRFVAGLASFLVAHLFYLAAFLSLARPVADATLVPYFAHLVLMYALLGRRLGRLLWAGVAYMITLLAMAWMALQVWLQAPGPGAAGLVAGTVLFVVSDSVLAFNRFRRRFLPAQAIVLGTYYVAQWLIARYAAI